jgi:hypothetical protein
MHALLLCLQIWVSTLMLLMDMHLSCCVWRGSEISFLLGTVLVCYCQSSLSLWVVYHSWILHYYITQLFSMTLSYMASKPMPQQQNSLPQAVSKRWKCGVQEMVRGHLQPNKNYTNWLTRKPMEVVWQMDDLQKRMFESLKRTWWLLEFTPVKRVICGTQGHTFGYMLWAFHCGLTNSFKSPEGPTVVCLGRSSLDKRFTLLSFSNWKGNYWANAKFWKDFDVWPELMYWNDPASQDCLLSIVGEGYLSCINHAFTLKRYPATWSRVFQCSWPTSIHGFIQ